MKLRRAIVFTILPAALFPAAFLVAQSSNFTAAPVPASAPVYKPDTTHENDPMPSGIFVWNSQDLTTNLPANTAQAHFLFTFTNVAVGISKTQVTNIVRNLASPRNQSASPSARAVSLTNILWVTNSSGPIPVAVLDVHPSCGCTTAQLPSLPWIIPGGGSGQIPISVNVEGKTGTLFKTVRFATDKGMTQLLLQIKIAPVVAPTMTEADRARGIAAAKIDRQAVFHNDCATCHAKNGDGKYGKALFDSDCAICHEAEHRASFVADLHNLKVPTNVDFWQTWIAHGKPGSFMPAFSQPDGGPLSDMQIASLAVYLNQAIPSKVPPAPQ